MFIIFANGGEKPGYKHWFKKDEILEFNWCGDSQTLSGGYKKSHSWTIQYNITISV